MVVLEKDNVFKCLCEVLSKRGDVSLAYLFGSVVEKSYSLHDVDVAILLKDKDPDEKLYALGSILAETASKLSINEDMVNLVDMERAPQSLLYNIIRYGMKIVGSEEVEHELIETLLVKYPDFKIELRTWMNLNPNPKVDSSIVESRIAELRRNVEYLRAEILTRSLSDITSSYKDQLAMERAMHRALEAIFDLCRHLISVHNLGLAESYAEYPKRLAENNLMPKDLAEDLMRFIGIRNMLVHRYLELDYSVLYNAVRHLVEEVFPKFVEWISNFMKR
ncbi:DUF86 domain-containing protein [Candidatus Bathyarchaeota archaeon]|nr:DUF86 domain-containing protein [Candidatus Bathyarchaeota archaeon]